MLLKTVFGWFYWFMWCFTPAAVARQWRRHGEALRHGRQEEFVRDVNRHRPPAVSPHRSLVLSTDINLKIRFQSKSIALN